MEFFVYKGARKSRGAVKLGKELDVAVLTPDNTMRQSRRGDVVINWGCTKMYGIPPGNTILNKPEFIWNAVDKIKCLTAMNEAGVPAPKWTTSLAVAQGWARLGFVVFCRLDKYGEQGRDIVVARSEKDVVPAQFYSKGINVQYEWRVNVVRDKMVNLLRKGKMIGHKSKEPLVRSYENGYVFVNDSNEWGPKHNAALEAIGVAAIKAAGLDFGGVDVIEAEDGQFYVLEINTSPSLEGSIAECYANAFLKLKF